MIWFTSDTHAWHENIIKYCNRPFTNATQMTVALADNINKLVKPDDTLWHLGDFAFGLSERDIYKFRGMINCRKVNLILGNHDKFIKKQKEKFKTTFTTIIPFGIDIVVSGQPITLCHYALRVWNKSHYGAWHLYGHSHGTLGSMGQYDMDVGVDALGYKPISFEELHDKQS